MTLSVVDQVVEQLAVLPPSLQQQVLQFARRLSQSEHKGVHGSTLLKFAGAIPAEDLQVMSDAIHQDCGQVDLNEW